MQNGTPDLAEPLSRTADFESLSDPTSLGQLVPTGSTMIQTQGREITAKKVAVPRDLKKIMQQLKVYAAQFGEAFYYSWEANDRKNKRKALIEGGTIKLANALVNLWGNCAVEVDVHETRTHWILKAWFIDYERGVAVSRLFQQRKGQETGMRDSERQADIVFQIGQSKAIRNVVLNALSTLADFAVDESKQALTQRFKDPENAAKAGAFIDRIMSEHAIAPMRVEAVVGRKRPQWTVQDLARVYAEMRGIHEGLTVADEVYPTERDAAEVSSEKAEKDKADRARSDTAGAGEGKAKTETPPEEGTDAAAGKSGAASAAASSEPAKGNGNGKVAQAAKTPPAEDDVDAFN